MMASDLAHDCCAARRRAAGAGGRQTGVAAIAVPATRFFDKTYDEALGLTHEARRFIASVDGSRLSDAPFSTRLIYARETLRLTARLTQVMAWLLYQKAVHAGEIDRAEAAAPDKRLGGRAICSEHDEVALTMLPPPLQGLMARSHRLYVRVARLDEMVGRDPEVRPGPPPVRF